MGLFLKLSLSLLTIGFVEIQEEKKAGASPLSQYAASLQQRAAQRQAALHTTRSFLISKLMYV